MNFIVITCDEQRALCCCVFSVTTEVMMLIKWCRSPSAVVTFMYDPKTAQLVEAMEGQSTL